MLQRQFSTCDIPVFAKKDTCKATGFNARFCNFSRSSSPDCCKIEHAKIFEIKESEIQLRYLGYVSSVKGK